MVISGNPAPGISAVCIKFSSIPIVDCICQQLQICHGRNLPRVSFRAGAAAVGGHFGAGRCCAALCVALILRQRCCRQQTQAQGQGEQYASDAFFHGILLSRYGSMVSAPARPGRARSRDKEGLSRSGHYGIKARLYREFLILF